ncbi:hypothetical protein ACI7RC_04835 [Brevibacillus sp. B_LB10_24]|uniref:hypothetical protein n=1 Tax=Brevibacillus sp. B_LB10_24 TaxID=3380645 RepID=UPI0038B71980
MDKHLYFIVSLKDAVRLNSELLRRGISRYYLQPHGEGVAFVFEKVSRFRRVTLQHLFRTDGELQ